MYELGDKVTINQASSFTGVIDYQREEIEHVQREQTVGVIIRIDREHASCNKVHFRTKMKDYWFTDRQLTAAHVQAQKVNHDDE